MRKVTALLMLVPIITGCKKPETALNSEPVGRYQIVINMHKFDGERPEGNSTEAFLIDTAKGRVWGFNREWSGFNLEDRVSMHFSRIDIMDEDGAVGPTSSQFFQQNREMNKKRLEYFRSEALKAKETKKQGHE